MIAFTAQPSGAIKKYKKFIATIRIWTHLFCVFRIYSSKKEEKEEKEKCASVRNVFFDEFRIASELFQCQNAQHECNKL